MDTPAPILLNTWKHHAGALRTRIEEAIRSGPQGLPMLASQLIVVGTDLMDLYVGELTPAQITTNFIEQLESDGHRAFEAYRSWIEAGRGYRVAAMAADGSRWVFRLGDRPEHYVHIHPARNSPHTRRVRANVLKTAAMVLAFIGIHGGSLQDRAIIDRVRRDYLGLAPMGRDVRGDMGLGALLHLLQSR